jgi:hypothetical protein
LLFNAALGLYQERRSEAALTHLKALAGAHAWWFETDNSFTLRLTPSSQAIGCGSTPAIGCLPTEYSRTLAA